ncbi:hypothetical protein Bca101_052907 [Brassica carinata]
MVLVIRSAKALRSVHPLFQETATLTTALFNSRQEFLSCCERGFSCLSSDGNLSYKEILRSGIGGIKKDDAVHLFQSMLRSRPLPNVTDFNKLFSGVAKTKQYDLVLSLCKQMDMKGVSSDIYTLSIIINCFCRRRELGFAFSIMGKGLKLGYELDTITFSTLVNGLCLEGRVSEAVALVDRMVEMKVRPDHITLTMLVNGLCLKGYVSEAMGLIDRMMRHGIQPDGVTYGPVLNRMCKSGETSMALDLLRKMEGRNIKLNAAKYNIIIDSLCKDGSLDDALNLFNEMETKGIKADVITYNSLIGGFCKAGRWDDGAQLLDMITRKITPDVITLNALIDSLVKERKLKEAKELCDEMIARGIDPNTITYNSLIDGLCIENRLDEANQMLDLMVSKGCDPDIVTFNILINGYCKAKLVDEGMRIFREISLRGFVADTVTYSTLVQGFCEAGKLNVAKQLFQEMVSRGVSPNVVTYGILLDGLCDNGELEEALGILEKMHKSKMDPGIGIYNIIIRGMCNARRVDDAWELFSSLSLKGVKGDVKTYTTIIGGLCKKGSLSEAYMLFKKMGEDGIAPNERTYNTLIRAHLGGSGVATSVELIEEMKRCGFSADASTMKMRLPSFLLAKQHTRVTMAAAASVSTRFLVLLQDFSAFRKISSWRSAASNYHRQSRLLCHVAKEDGSLTLASLELGNNPRRSGKSKAMKLEGSFVSEMSQGKVRGAMKVVKEKKPAEIVSPLFSANSFEELGLPDSLLDSLEREGFSVPTDVQSAAVPAIIKGHDAVIQSYTGSGKTLAYLLPILSEIGPLSGKAKSSEKRAEIQAMIVAPSRELGMQIVREVEKLLGPDHRRMVQQLVGGANRMRQEEALKKNKPAIVVGTPGRIAEISKSGRLHTHGCRFLVLDEVDELLSFNFREDIHRIIEHVGRRAGAGPKGEVDERANRQTILVSATVPFSVIRAAKSWSHEPVLVQANKVTPLDTVQPTAPAISLTPTTSEADGQIQTTIQSLPPALKHFYCISKHQHKVDALRRCVHALEAQSVIAFMNHSKQLKDVVYKLEARGMSCAELHGDLGKLGRSTVLKKFKNGEVRVLVTNELSARGLDVAECDLVVNLELPTDAVHYAHRAGRTGRLGRKGTVVTVCEESQVFIVKKMEKQLGLPFEYCEFVDGELVVTEEDKAIIR